MASVDKSSPASRPSALKSNVPREPLLGTPVTQPHTKVAKLTETGEEGTGVRGAGDSQVGGVPGGGSGGGFSGLGCRLEVRLLT